MHRDYPAIGCDTALVSSYFDGELGPKEFEKVRAHLDVCPSCRQALKDYRVVSKTFQSGVTAECSQVDFVFFEESLLARLKKQPTTWKNKLIESITDKRFYIPAAALASVLIIFFTFFYPTGTPTSPSAIITSYTGNTSSVMIFETPKTHQTILWFSEDPPANGKEHAL